MNTEFVGKMIASVRKECGMTQEQLSEKVGVSVQAVSKWENGRNLPDIDNLMRIAEITNTPYQFFLEEEEAPREALTFRSRLFNEENMYTRMRAIALAEDLTETYRALPYMKAQHMGQFRKKARYTNELVRYINHPLMMACHAHALGIRDDALLAAILLHDVVEDTDACIGDLPFSDEVRELVGLVTFSVPDGKTKEEGKTLYYEAISKNPKACVIKLLDRCSNVSTMAGTFSREKLVEYIDETERFVLPLNTVLKDKSPEYSSAAFVAKYHILSVIESIKYMMVK